VAAFRDLFKLMKKVASEAFIPKESNHASDEPRIRGQGPGFNRRSERRSLGHRQDERIEARWQ
jgi:hypothetical protein